MSADIDMAAATPRNYPIEPKTTNDGTLNQREQGIQIEADAEHSKSNIELGRGVVVEEVPNDAEDPKNWPDSKKWGHVATLSILTILTPLGSSMFAPGIPAILDEFHERSDAMATFIMSVYFLGFAFGPLVVAPLSEIYGRRPLYLYGNIIFVIFTVCTAVSNSIGMLLAFRLLMGLTGCVPVTIGSGSIADIMPAEKRGRAMSVWALGPLLGPCVGPVAGGVLIEALGWRWVYWIISILGTLVFPLNFFFLKETFAPVLLDKRAKARQTVAVAGNLDRQSQLPSLGNPRRNIHKALIRPLLLLLRAPVVTVSAIYIAIVYGIMNLLITTFSFVYLDTYGFGEAESGLAFLPGGLGMVIGVLLFGQLTDLVVLRHMVGGTTYKPEARLVPLLTIPSGLALPIGLLLYGWAAAGHIHWIVPMIGVSIFTIGMMGITACLQSYLLDTHLQYAASVTAALTVLRSLLGAFLPLGGLQMYNALGLGWGNSLLAFISLILFPIPLVLYILGERIRNTFRTNV
ncbi:polyamine transporter 3 [Dactylonectria macrodidyma]|uniref:Polyamine transporter 3 n=1 Tax=Dactylonectria macrodidyma TaxID=307937 RepID=A0A9P9J3S6_9HYPO|nr:polyamine transporter 3 [Dactylonectria macrodidyma]